MSAHRYQVRASHADGAPTIYRVWDGHARVYVLGFTREVLAEAACARLEREHQARRARAEAAS
jgi:hypothetical protein